AAADPNADRAADENEAQATKRQSRAHLHLGVECGDLLIEGGDALLEIGQMLGNIVRPPCECPLRRDHGDLQLVRLHAVMQLGPLLHDLLPGAIAARIAWLVSRAMGQIDLEFLSCEVYMT